MLLPLAECADAPASLVGRKAANLAWAQRQGMQTPGGLVLSVDAFRGALAAAGFAMRIRYLEEAVLALDPTHSIAIATAAKSAMTPEVLLPMANAFAADIAALLGPAPLACRSSAAMEDGFGSAFPGLYLSVLDVQTADALAEAILACWQSALAPGLLHYLYRRCPWPVDFGLALLVQPMVQAEWYGLCFTADPLQRHPGAVVELSRAGPSALVDGAAADVHLWHDGARWQGGVAPEGLDALLLWSGRVSAHQGGPVDIEFALASGAPVLLQWRPLTSLGGASHGSIPAGALRGLPGAPGCVEGRVGDTIALVERLEPQQIDRILVSKAILAKAAASPLSHAAIVCRELGVALVTGLGADVALETYQVRVDGAAGYVLVLE